MSLAEPVRPAWRIPIERLRAAFPSPPVSRFAPAPTGRLHLGHVVNAIYVWGITRALGGRILLRIEDHDRQRCRPEYEAGILEDLAWLGFEPDEPAVYQRERGDLYEASLDRLRRAGLVYACECSRAAIARTADASAAEPRYPGTCAARGLPERPGRAVRIRLADRPVAFDDLRRGPTVQRPARQCGDLLARDREGNWTYQFAVTVDDLRQGITLVIRGDDLLESTGRQIALARLLGRDASPRYLHHALVMKDPSQKLSKSDHATAIGALRAAGASPAEVIGRAAARIGLIAAVDPVAADRVAGLVVL